MSGIASAELSAAVAMAAMLTLGTAAIAAPKCVLAGGEATMVTEDLAKFMAGSALKNSISGMGAKPSGAVKMTCKGAALAGTHCLAQQKACK